MNEKIDLSLYIPPKNKYKAYLFKIIRHSYFDIGIMCFIIGNTITMCFERQDQTNDESIIIKDCYLVFSFVFIFEAILKIFVLGFANYMNNDWNK